ncbi:hypothetical protein VTH06DRAFT_6520 [Thermothelomyces fergusii]
MLSTIAFGSRRTTHTTNHFFFSNSRASTTFLLLRRFPSFSATVLLFLSHTSVTMADQIQEILDVPREFVKDGVQFINRAQKPDRREFIKISQAVGVGFLIMGAVGYFVKLTAADLGNSLDAQVGGTWEG